MSSENTEGALNDSVSITLQSWSLARLTERCTDETRRFVRGQEHDDRYCYEIFRRAIVERDEVAWTALHVQYQSLIHDWIWQHSLATSLDNHDDLINRVFERVWQAIRPEKFASFTHLTSLLRYVKLCTFATVIDEARARRSWDERRADDALADELEGERVDDAVIDTLSHQALWQQIQASLPDPAERLAIYLGCVIGLKPRDIARRHARNFPTVEAVYRATRLAKERLRRDERLRSLWETAV